MKLEHKSQSGKLNGIMHKSIRSVEFKLLGLTYVVIQNQTNNALMQTKLSMCSKTQELGFHDKIKYHDVIPMN